MKHFLRGIAFVDGCIWDILQVGSCGKYPKCDVCLSMWCNVEITDWQQGWLLDHQFTQQYPALYSLRWSSLCARWCCVVSFHGMQLWHGMLNNSLRAKLCAHVRLSERSNMQQIWRLLQLHCRIPGTSRTEGIWADWLWTTASLYRLRFRSCNKKSSQLNKSACCNLQLFVHGVEQGKIPALPHCVQGHPLIVHGDGLKLRKNHLQSVSK